jgi:hypothetical protein
MPSLPQELIAHADNTMAGILNISQRRRDQALDAAERLDEAITALDYLATRLVEMRDQYGVIVRDEEATISRLQAFIDLPSAAPSTTMPSPVQQVPVPVPTAGPYGSQLRPMSDIDLRPDAEGRRPVGISQLTPEMREKWKEMPAPTVSVHGPGDPLYVPAGQKPAPLPIPVEVVEKMPDPGE